MTGQPYQLDFVGGILDGHRELSLDVPSGQLAVALRLPADPNGSDASEPRQHVVIYKMKDACWIDDEGIPALRFRLEYYGPAPRRSRMQKLPPWTWLRKLRARFTRRNSGTTTLSPMGSFVAESMERHLGSRPTCETNTPHRWPSNRASTRQAHQ